MIRPAIATMTSGAKVSGRLTTAHPASSYGQPVFVADDGTVFNWADIADIDTAAPERARGGKSKSDAKRAAAASNGKRGGRPKKIRNMADCV